MPISGTDIQHLQSASAGSSGGAITGSGITSGVANNVWPNVTDPQRIAGIVTTRKTFFKNNHGTDAMIAPIAFFSVAPTNATLLLGLGVNDTADDDPLQGNMSAFGANAVASLVSDGADTRVVTIIGMNNAGTPVPTLETVTLNGTTPVSSVTTWSRIFGWYVATTSASRTVTLKQGVGGTLRGTIGLNKKMSFLWVAAGTAKVSGLTLPDLAAGQNYGIWRQLTVTAGAGTVKPDTLTVRFEEA